MKSQLGELERFMNYFINSPDFVFILDMNGKIINANNVVYSELKYSREDIIGENILMLCPTKFRKEAKPVIKKMLEGKCDNCSIPFITKEGEHIPVDTRIFKSTLNFQDVLISISRNMNDLKLAELKYSKLFHFLPVMMLIVQFEDNRVINVNNNFLQTFNYDPDDVIGKKVKDLNLLVDKNYYNRIKSDIEISGKLKNGEILLRTKKRNLLNCAYSIELVDIQTGKYAMISIVNITHLKNREKRLDYLLKQQHLLARISELLYDIGNGQYPLQQVINLLGQHTDSSKVYLFENDCNSNTANNTFEWCNQNIDPQINKLQNISYKDIPSWKKILLEDGSIFSRNISQLPEDIKMILEKQKIKSILVLPIYLENEFSGFIGFEECNKKNKIWNAEDIELLKVVSNMISHYYEKRAMHKKLIYCHLKQILAIESSKGAFWDYNFVTDNIYFNNQFFSVFGHNKDDSSILSKATSFQNFIHQDGLVIIKKSIKNHIDDLSEHFDFTTRIKTKHEEWKSILCRGIINERDTKGKPLSAIGIIIDITFQKNIEEQLKKSIVVRDSLLSVISHDYLKPIGMFVPILDTIISEKDLDSDIVISLLKEMKNTATITYSMMENLLNWSKLQLKAVNFNPVSFQINEIIQENINLCSFSAKNKNIDIIKNIENNVNVYADKEAIKIVIRNILSNAIKFTPVNGKIYISAIYNINNAIIEIKDNGVGISEKKLTKIFNESELISTLGTNNEKGNGMGLIISHNLIKENKGKITVESSPNKGSTFRIMLPVN